MNSAVVVFYREKINDIFTSFFIKYFNKHKDKFKNNTNTLENDDTLDTFKKFLLSFSKNSDEIYKSFTSFEIYIGKKYKLDYSTLNTSLYIYIKESIQEMLNMKIKYDKNDELKHFYYKCCKKIACHLYENYNCNYLDYKRIIQNTVKNTLTELIPIDFITNNYINTQHKTDKKEHNKNEHDKKEHDKKENDKAILKDKQESSVSVVSVKLNSDRDLDNNKTQPKESSESTIKIKKSDHDTIKKDISQHSVKKK